MALTKNQLIEYIDALQTYIQDEVGIPIDEVHLQLYETFGYRAPNFEPDEDEDEDWMEEEE